MVCPPLNFQFFNLADTAVGPPNGLKRTCALDRHAAVHWMDTTASIQLKFMRPLDGQTRFNPIETCVSMGWTQRPPPNAGNLALGMAAFSPASQPNTANYSKTAPRVAAPSGCLRQGDMRTNQTRIDIARAITAGMVRMLRRVVPLTTATPVSTSRLNFVANIDTIAATGAEADTTSASII